VCRFDHENPQDEQQGELETMVVNHILHAAEQRVLHNA
jgi:hypothetical protein